LLAVLALTSVTAAYVEDDFPQQLHIAAGSRTSFRVSWKTQTVTASSCVFGSSTENLNHSASGLPGYQYLEDHGYHHTVLLDDLPLDSKYFYSCGDGGSFMSDTIGFNTAPSPTSPVSMAIFGDWGYEDSEERPMAAFANIGGLHKNWTATLTRQLLESLKDNSEMSMMWIVGDVGYADDSFGHKGAVVTLGYEPCYDGFMQWNENISKIMPFMVSAGNHESECHDPYCILHLGTTGKALSNFSAYNARFAMPSPESGGVLSMWASWDWGPVHVTSINTETDWPGAGEEFTGDSHISALPAGGFGGEGEYMAWLEADLAKASTNPDVSWIIAGGHRPFSSLNSDMQEQLVALFKRYGVAMYFAGHGHSYTRFDKGAWGDDAVHVMAGGAGNDETLFPPDQFDPIDSATNTTTPLEDCLAWCARQKAFTASLAAVSTAAVAVEEGGVEGGGGASLSIPSEGSDSHGDPCVHCSPPGLGADPVFATDKMSAGVLKATTEALEWSLLRAPDGLVLDTITITK
jgi:hypothetical protein